MSKLCIALLVSMQIVGGIGQLFLERPTIYWSMDTIEGDILRPDIGDITNWSGDLSSINGTYVSTGVDGHALVLDKMGIRVAKDLIDTGGECLFTPTVCEGLTVAMWINVKEWTDLLDWIFWTGAHVFNYPGIAIFPDVIDRISLSVNVLLPDGTLYEASVSQDLVGVDQWTHVATTWSQANGVKIYINGTEAAAYTKEPTIGTGRVLSHGFRLPLRFGDDQISFVMDELKVWYRELQPSEIALTPIVGVDTEIATASSAVVTTLMTTTPSPTTTVTMTSTAAATTAITTIPTTITLSTAAATSVVATTAVATTKPTTTIATTAIKSPITTAVATTNMVTTSPTHPVTLATSKPLTTTTTAPSVTTTTTVPSTTKVRPAPVTTTSTSSTTTSTTATPRPPDSTAVNPEGFWSVGTIIAVSVGASIALLAFCIACIVCVCLRRREEEKRSAPTRV